MNHNELHSNRSKGHNLKSITIHALDDDTAELIRKKAEKEGISLNKTIKRLLRQALGLRESVQPDHREEFRDLFALWSDEEARELAKQVESFEKVDPSDWE